MNFNNNFQKINSGRHFILIGGFLGAGKTTLISYITRLLEVTHHKIALITNDQGQGLMDTDSARQAMQNGGSVAEITGGCFCCKLDELVDRIKDLEGSTRPDVLIAEPVGSCTDLMATVLKPLEQIYKTPLILAPLVVVLDARRALASLGGKTARRSFHRDVGYVYLKQLEKAEWLVVNKCDLLSENELHDLSDKLIEKYPGKKIYSISAKTGSGLEVLLNDLLDSERTSAESIEMDYERYADGEALLGWVNMEAGVSLAGDPGSWLRKVGEEIAESLDEKGHEVGHFKMSLRGQGKRWRIHQVMGGEEVELIEEDLEDEVRGTPELGMLVNLRAEGDAVILQEIVRGVLEGQSEAEIEFREEAAFQPGKPVPVHRIG